LQILKLEERNLMDVSQKTPGEAIHAYLKKVLKKAAIAAYKRCFADIKAGRKK
jgi:hypothetical protein